MVYTGNPETDAKIEEWLQWAINYYKIPREDIALQVGDARHPDYTSGHYGHRFLTTRIVDGHAVSFHRKLYREDGYNKASPRKPVEKQEPITVTDSYTGSDTNIPIANAPTILPPET